MENFFKYIVISIVAIIVLSALALVFIESRRSVMDRRGPIILNMEPDR